MASGNLNLLQQAITLHRQGNLYQARVLYLRILEQEPDQPDALHLLGVLASQIGAWSEAIPLLQRVLARYPENPLIHVHLGHARQKQQKYDAAVRHYMAALSLDPACTVARQHLEDLLAALGLFQPDSGLAFNNRGALLLETGHLEAALADFDQALALQPDLADAGYHRALVYLMQGRWAEGFQEYDTWRYRLPDERCPPSRLAPLWDGSPLRGRAILVLAEQGAGDIIQFARYLPLVTRRGGRVLLQCPAHLVRLLQTIPSLEQVLAEEAPLPHFDWQVPLISLARIFETVPGEVPYLDNPQLNTGVIPHSKFLKIGFVWAGNPQHLNDFKRSCPLAYWRPLFELPGIEWYSLQVGERVDDLYRPHPVSPPDSQASPSTPASASPPLAKRGPGGVPTIIDLSPAIQDFADTAAIISQLDLIISVDTAVAHLAGALAKPVWILLSHIPDWRWMLKRSDSPWYPTARLFRQSSPGDWDSVIAQVQQALAY